MGKFSSNLQDHDKSGRVVLSGKEVRIWLGEHIRILHEVARESGLGELTTIRPKRRTARLFAECHVEEDFLKSCISFVSPLYSSFYLSSLSFLLSLFSI